MRANGSSNPATVLITMASTSGAGARGDGLVRVRTVNRLALSDRADTGSMRPTRPSAMDLTPRTESCRPRAG